MTRLIFDLPDGAIKDEVTLVNIFVEVIGKVERRVTLKVIEEAFKEALHEWD